MWCVVISWTGLIFFLSAQPASQSSATSKLVSEVVATIVYEEPTPERVNQVDDYVRETAHFLIFTLLGFFTCLAMIRTNMAKQALLITVAACTVYALTDEIHQFFVLGRSFQLLDLALDFCGSVLGVALCLLFFGRCLRMNNTKDWMNLNNNSKGSSAHRSYETRCSKD